MTNRFSFVKRLRQLPAALCFALAVTGLSSVCATPAAQAGEEAAAMPNLVGNPLAIGDMAPAIAGVEWMNTPAADPSTPDGKSVYLVDFWGTWVQPCSVSIPHLNDLSEKYKDKGLVVIGISQEKSDVVKAFLEKTAMKYHVAVDSTGSAGPVYMNGIQGMPHSFIFDRTGALVWHGHPLDNIEHVIRQVLNGKLDAGKAKEIDALRQSLSSVRDPGKALEVFDKLIAVDGANPQYYAIKVNILTQMGKQDGIPTVYTAWAQGCADSSEGLVELAMSTLRQADIDLRNAKLAAESVRKAVNAADADVSTLILGSQALCEMGMLEEAIALLSKPREGLNDSQSKAIANYLAYFNTLLQLRNK